MDSLIQPAKETRSNLLPWKGLRAAILVELKRVQRATARELAVRLGVSLNAVRHHLKDLETEALVEYERKHKGVGAPVFAYRLSAGGEALFPRRYEATVTDLLEHLVQREGRAAAVAALEQRYENLTHRLQSKLVGAAPAQRLAAVAQLLSEEGYMAEASASGAEGILVEHNCAIQAVAERFPEICAAEARFLSSVLGGEVDRRGHILAGCSACEYRIRFEAPHGDTAISAIASVDGSAAAPTSGESV
jgi:DeoR family suf operon transcriptional repressor